MTNQLGLGYSIKMFLENETGIDTILMFDGIRLPKVKPFIIVKQMTNNNQYVAKQRETIQTTYRYEVGLFAESYAERTAVQGEIRDLFFFDDIPLYDESGRKTTKYFQVSVTSEVPLDAGDVSDKTNMHRIYFDIEVVGTKHKNRRNRI